MTTIQKIKLIVKPSTKQPDKQPIDIVNTNMESNKNTNTNISKSISSSTSTEFDKYQIIKSYAITDKLLGSGATSFVYLGYNTQTNKKVAVKKYTNLKNKSTQYNKALREIELLIKINHPHIIKLYDYYRDTETNEIYLFLEYCHNGSLKKFLGKNGYLDEKACNKLMYQLMLALKYLYHNGIYHRDIKLHNLLLTKKYKLKVSDFGLATLNMKGTLKKICGSPLYMSPEIILYNSYNSKSDLWSVGIVIYEILFGHNPYSNKLISNNLENLINYVKQKIVIDIPPLDKPIDANVPDICKNLISNLLIFEPENRINWDNYFHHEWFNLLKSQDNQNSLRN